ncbi:hypothetical protein BDK51DRAFT_40742 [Blyttiomyces helicus]|uniref:Lebercilin domain-containing protein n=1 Tax=Blyttiomyces helicus TaxID=388810 RepID=A0A4V1ISH9_9FUNG|nr:hypothetical protein BDK51DRAFT_40742 [Blyttiomyces helicus]|eukprot:RKO93617.1 hypothetical protein BDK51DRAFT_40742 [Blyttiomyces helicus]
MEDHGYDSDFEVMPQPRKLVMYGLGGSETDMYHSRKVDVETASQSWDDTKETASAGQDPPVYPISKPPKRAPKKEPPREPVPSRKQTLRAILHNPAISQTPSANPTATYKLSSQAAAVSTGPLAAIRKRRSNQSKTGLKKSKAPPVPPPRGLNPVSEASRFEEIAKLVKIIDGQSHQIALMKEEAKSNNMASESDVLRRQERFMQRMEKEQTDLPRLVTSLTDEIRILKSERLKYIEKIALIERNAQMQVEENVRLQAANQSMMAILRAKKLENADQLSEEVERLKATLATRNASIAELERTIKNQAGAKSVRLRDAKATVAQLSKELEQLRIDHDVALHKIQERDKTVDRLSIYAQAGQRTRKSERQRRLTNQSEEVDTDDTRSVAPSVGRSVAGHSEREDRDREGDEGVRRLTMRSGSPVRMIVAAENAIARMRGEKRSESPTKRVEVAGTQATAKLAKAALSRSTSERVSSTVDDPIFPITAQPQIQSGDRSSPFTSSPSLSPTPEATWNTIHKPAPWILGPPRSMAKPPQPSNTSSFLPRPAPNDLGLDFS